VQFNTPCTINVTGITSSGKSTWVRQLLEKRNQYFDKKIEKVLYCYSVWSDTFAELEQDEDIQFYENLPDEEIIKTLPKSSIVVLDDMMTEVVNSKFIQSMFTKLSHHLCINIIYITQNMFCKGSVARTINLNTSYYVLMRNLRDIQQIRYLGRQICMEKTLLEAYRDVMLKPFNHLIINLSPYSDLNIRLFSNIFDYEYVIGYKEK